MNIHILPPEIISKIAAGEVIERPASVIKELLENALDAQTRSIELHLQQAGKTLIHIKDTGIGIDQEDLETIFLRHSTSKIQNIDDLFAIKSLGFRGEALYSVAAIADVILRSKTKTQDTGWEIHMRGGEKLDLRPVTMSVGTDLEVRELFFNTPARRKFLKSSTTELNQILNIVIPYSLLYPQCRFLLTHQEKTLLDLKPTDDHLARIAETLHLETDHLLEARQDFPGQETSVHMVMGDINITRSRRDMQFIFINNRPVQNKSIGFHMNNVYRLILPQGSYPFFALFVQIPAGDIDANIHPTKREVKIRDEQNLTALLRHMCEANLLSAGKAKQVEVPQNKCEAAEPSRVQQALSSTHAYSLGFDATLPPEIFEPPAAPASSSDDERENGAGRPNPTEQYTFPTNEPYSMVGETLFTQKKDNLQNKLSRARHIGSFINKFLLFEVEQSLLVVDQHAAQERITFEQLIRQMEKGRIEVQQLLSPYLIKLSVQDLLNWEEAKDRLDEIGFSSTQFDDETIAVHTYPVLIKDPARAVSDILAGGDVARCGHETIARRACRASVMAGDILKPSQAEFQREQLIQCRDPFTCPHGRPTVIEMKEDFLNKQFLRK